MFFNGTIVITDPCYLDCGMPEKFEDYWDYEHLNPNYFPTNLCDYTGYGDWSCTTFKTGNIVPDIDKEVSPYMTIENKIGKFCADSGMVCVVLLDDIIKMNPNFSEWALKNPWCVTVLPYWKGDITIHDNTFTGSRSIIGIGDKHYNFFTIQTGL